MFELQGMIKSLEKSVVCESVCNFVVEEREKRTRCDGIKYGGRLYIFAFLIFGHAEEMKWTKVPREVE